MGVLYRLGLTYFAYFRLDGAFSTTELKDTCIFFCLFFVFWGSLSGIAAYPARGNLGTKWGKIVIVMRFLGEPYCSLENQFNLFYRASS